MPTPKLFNSVPPFPEDLRRATLRKIALKGLLSGDEVESKELFEACKTDGFFLLDMRGTVVGDSLLELAGKMFAVTKEMFDEGKEELTKFAQPPPGVLGYKALGSMKVESGAPDRLEWYVLSQDDILGNITPLPKAKTLESNGSTLKAYLQTSNQIVSLLCQHLDTHLHLPQGTLSSRQRPTHGSGSIIRMLKYPPQSASDRRTSLFGHTDIGTVTLLFNVLGGLQILPPGCENKEEIWRYVKPEPGCAIVNLGDTMREWTGGILKSNLHRVTYAPGDQGSFTRYSVAYLARPEGGASMKRLALKGSLIEKFEGDEEVEVTADEWVRRKTTLANLAKDPARERDGRAVKAG